MLIDIVELIQDCDKLNPLRNKFGIDQVQMNFSIIDGEWFIELFSILDIL